MEYIWQCAICRKIYSTQHEAQECQDGHGRVVTTDKLAQYAPSYLFPCVKSKKKIQREELARVCEEEFTARYPNPDTFDGREALWRDWYKQLLRYTWDCYKEAGVFDERKDKPFWPK